MGDLQIPAYELLQALEYDAGTDEIVGAALKHKT